jgi:RNA polymerase sigma-70 factor (ECF subfamily)
MTELPLTDDRLGELMRQAQAGDAGAYVVLLRELTPRLRRIITRQRGFAGAAGVEDLLQDVLLSLHRVRATYNPSRPFMPWLLAILRHRLVDGARRHGRTTGREVALDAGDVAIADLAANPDQGRSDDVAAVRKAVEALPPGQRQAIELLKLQELSLKEAAAASGTSVGALKVATHRGMAALRKALRRNADDHR